jgi:hypothetical protein
MAKPAQKQMAPNARPVPGQGAIPKQHPGSFEETVPIKPPGPKPEGTLDVEGGEPSRVKSPQKEPRKKLAVSFEETIPIPPPTGKPSNALDVKGE